MALFECQSAAARAIASNIPLHPKAGFDCEDDDCPGQKSNGQRQPCRPQRCAMCCSVSAAFGAAMMAVFFLVGPCIMHMMFASEVTTHNHSQSIGKFMMPNARPFASRRRPGAIIRRPPFELPSMVVPSSIRPGAGGSNKHFEVAQIGAEVKELEKMLAEQEMHVGHSKNLEVHEGKNGATGEPTPENALAQLIACFLVVIGVIGALLYSRTDRHVVRSIRPLSRSRLAATTMSANDTLEADSAEDSTGMSGAAGDIKYNKAELEAKLKEAVACEDYKAAAALKAELDAPPEVMEEMYASLRKRVSQLSSRRAQLMQEREEIKAFADERLLDGLAQRSILTHWFGEFGDEARMKLSEAVDGAVKHDASKLESLIEEYPDWMEPVYQLASLRYVTDDFAQSAALCHKILRQKPWHVWAASLVVVCYAKMGETQKAKEMRMDAMPKSWPERKQWVERMVVAINSKLEVLDEITNESS